MENEKRSIYDKLPLELLAGFYYEINKNIEKGILSDAMYHEIRLIEQNALKRGISLEYLHDKGACIIEVEKLIRETILQHQIVE
ncbi:hypothetical protein ACQKGD_09460 [Peribacillus frigoritolerans]|uniref:hypothetical protein n=1 Tax=Peribacillus frigoritolerans TaxID=450367 RepID=UPI002079B033|nr:hypothetical protein [Peribacillus frigoritolerans]USK68111.1 hypothetical protein LIT26_30155 [Peribacillus frigoritolerans]